MLPGTNLCTPSSLHERLERLYARYNHREFVHPDPLEKIYPFEDTADREVAGLVASTLAYGNVKQILRSVETVLAVMGESPARYLTDSTSVSLTRDLAGFRHRMTSGEDLAAVLEGARRAVLEHGSLNACFLAGLKEDDPDVVGGLCAFVSSLSAADPTACAFNLADPGRRSACKRLNLYLRWMVRHDEVDPGGWSGVPPSMLIIPLDTHMFGICRALGFTGRGQADLQAAREATRGFAGIVPSDPVRYDFSLTRPGIRRERGLEDLVGAV
ncbi:MAG: TIGR02757 family protein [Actinobacteria bacterium]|nr:TIGR02757 family protein [Actinomycetota bacterium]MBU1943707.1 TIGR02757 family protein [Actinomycetota bacterium]MBU2686149.1 TIGR02757 family protein [Actinomycetota bacterium]